jgi:thymidylate synthase (FAD)
MTQVEDIDFDHQPYVRYLDKGFVGLVDHMGDDSAIVQAARTSYGQGTKSVSEDRALIRYLLRHEHTSVFEMVEFKFHLKIPIFVMRQHVRHRMASINEYSGRYSVMTDEFYIPDPDRLQTQSSINKQGSGDQLVGEELEMAHNTIKRMSTDAYMDYLSLINDEGGRSYNIQDRQGLSRELARIVLPINNYTELYWKIDLKNLFHYLNLRSDHHAQKEIQLLANAIGSYVKTICPIAYKAFEDYWKYSSKLSKQEIVLMKKLINKNVWLNLLEDFRDESGIAKNFGLSKRELNEFKSRWID